MTKYLKLNSFKTYVIASIVFLTATACEKHTGDLGLNTLPPQDGLSTHYDSIKFTDYTIVRDEYINSSQPYAKLLGSVIDTTGEGIYDTIICNMDVPIYFPQYPKGFSSSDTIRSIKIYLKYGKYAYSDFTDSTLKVKVTEFGNDTSNYSEILSLTLSTDTSLTPQKTIFTHDITGELYDRIEQGIYSIIKDTSYHRDSYGYKAESDERIKKDFHSNWFKGLTFTVYNPDNSFITKVTEPSIRISFGEEADNQYYFDLESFSSIYDDDYDGFIKRPITTITHSHSLNNTEGFLIQGALGHKSIIDFAPMFKWDDSSRYNFNRAKITFNIKEGTDSKAPVDSVVLKLYSNDVDADYAFAKLKNSSYTFNIHEHLNKIISNNQKLSDYKMEIYCLSNNTKANKSLLQFEEGNYIYLTYTKY